MQIYSLHINKHSIKRKEVDLKTVRGLIIIKNLVLGGMIFKSSKTVSKVDDQCLKIILKVRNSSEIN